jgi:hypothetical protein
MFEPRHRVGTLDGILVNVDSLSAEVPLPVDILAGFDAVIQFSRRLLQAQMIQSLSQKGVLAPGARMLWEPSVISPGLRDAVEARFRMSLVAREAHLEVRLVNPSIASLRWPILRPDVPEPPIETARRGGPARRESVTQRHLRSAEISWQLEISILTAQYLIAVDPQTPTPSSGAAELWDRTLVGRGIARTAAQPELEVSSRWRFGIELDFSETPPTVSSDEAAVAEFLTTDLGRGLLAQAVAPLTSASGIKLTPTVGPAGALTARQSQRLNLPSLQVRDTLLTDAHESPVLALCVDLGAPNGVLRLVQPFLTGHDFAYGASVNMLGPALKARWSLKATGLSVIGDVPVELRVSDDSEETATGRARVHVVIGNSLDDVAFKASTDHRGDLLRLLSQQTVKLLELWDHEGRRISELGPLAQPQTEPLALPFRFDAVQGDLASQLHPAMKELLLDLLRILVYPLLGPFRIKNISGSASSATQTLLSRWVLRTPVDDARPPAPSPGVRV